MMLKVGFITLGCKVNIYESNALEELLTKNNYQIIEPSPLCDVFIINTCSVTNTADQKSRQMISKCKKMNDNAVIVIMGCYVQTSHNTNLDADIIIGNGNKDEIVDLLKKALATKQKQIAIKDIMQMKEYDNLLVSTYDHARAFVKIEDGCNQFCSYCIIPYARGPIRSKKADIVIDEIKQIVSNGFNEVVLSGIHTGKYNDNGVKLSDLIERILNETNLKRLRLSSIEINEIDDKLMALLKENSVLANHFHLPLQQGTDTILKLMNRPYDTKYFKDKVNRIRKIRPNICLTTDVIVGFPYETDELYEASKQFIKEINFSYIHVFPYSKRSNTKASLMPQVNGLIKKIRSKDLNQLANELKKNYYINNLNNIEEVLFEKRDGEYLYGHTSNFIEVKVKTKEDYIKQIKKVKLDSYVDDIILASLI